MPICTYLRLLNADQIASTRGDLGCTHAYCVLCLHHGTRDGERHRPRPTICMFFGRPGLHVKLTAPGCRPFDKNKTTSTAPGPFFYHIKKLRANCDPSWLPQRPTQRHRSTIKIKVIIVSQEISFFLKKI
jgi:hypothetical protein